MIPVELTHKIAATLHRVGLAGAAVDLKTFHSLGKEWTREASKKKDLLVRAALQHGMKEFSPTVDAHIRELLFKKLKFPVRFKTEKENLPAVHKVALSQFADNKVVRLLLDFNSYDKLASTWYGRSDQDEKPGRLPSVRKLIKPIPNNTRIGLLHFWINTLGARTGRRSSGGYDEEISGTRIGRNSQNWSPKARGSIVSRWKAGKIASCDFKSLEPILYGFVSKDAKLLEFFMEGEGYIDIAREVFRKKIAKDSKEYKLVKNNVLGIFYNEKAYKLAYEFWYKLDIKLAGGFDDHLTKVSRMRNQVLKLFPGLRSYIAARRREVLETQQVVNKIGRVRHLPHQGPGSEKLWKLINQGINFPVQGLAGEVTGSALVDFEEALLKEHRISYLEWHRILLETPWDLPCSVAMNELHDEIDQDMHPRSGKKDLELLVETMKSLPTLREMIPGFDVKFRVDVEISPTWK